MKFEIDHDQCHDATDVAAVIISVDLEEIVNHLLLFHHLDGAFELEAMQKVNIVACHLL